MTQPFDLPNNHLPVIVPRPKVLPVKLIEGTVTHVAHVINTLLLKSDRDLFNIGHMLNILQIARLNPTERYVIRALQRRLTFDDKLNFPGLADTGKLLFVDGSNESLVWATITNGVIVTRSFTIRDLCDEGMALDKPKVMMEMIETIQKGCSTANPGSLFKRFQGFKARQRTEVNKALNILPELGVLRELIELDDHKYQAVFNPRLVASARSGIIRGILKAEDHHGTIITYGANLCTAEDPKKRGDVTAAGRRKKKTRAQYQSLSHSERAARIKAEMRIADYEDNGYLTAEQYADLRKLLDDPKTPNQVGETLTLILASVRCDLLTEIPEFLSEKDQRHA